MYIPLYTKYRPQTFDEVVEQKEVIDILKNQLSTNTIRNAYLFTGTSGSGKTTLARILAKEINKGKQGIVEMDAASHNGADDVRAILEKSNYQSFDAEYRIFLLDECHQYSTSAFSVWLKTLEEPPAKTIFMFCTTDPQKIPATILNRVQRFDLRRISYSGIVNRLSYIVENEKRERPELDISREVIEFIAKLSKGGMRDAITMLDKCIAYKPNIGIADVSKILGSVNYDVMFDLYFSVYNGDEKRVVEIIENIYNNGNDLKQLVSQFADFVADICKYKLFNNLEYIGIPDYYREQLNRAYGSDTKVLKNILKSMTELKSDIKYESSVLPIVETEFLLLSVDEEE